MGLLRTPEETRMPPISRAVEAVLPLYREVLARTPGLADVVRDEALLERHLAFTDRAPPRASGAFEVVDALAERKIRLAHDLEEAIATLTPEERGRVQAQPSLLSLLRALSADPAAGSFAGSRRPRPRSEAPRGRVDSPTDMPGAPEAG